MNEPSLRIGGHIFKYNPSIAYPIKHKRKQLCIEMIDHGILTEVQEKCTRSLAPSAERKQKFLSNQMAPDLCTVESVIKLVNQRDFS